MLASSAVNMGYKEILLHGNGVVMTVLEDALECYKLEAQGIVAR